MRREPANPELQTWQLSLVVVAEPGSQAVLAVIVPGLRQAGGLAGVQLAQLEEMAVRLGPVAAVAHMATSAPGCQVPALLAAQVGPVQLALLQRNKRMLAEVVRAVGALLSQAAAPIHWVRATQSQAGSAVVAAME